MKKPSSLIDDLPLEDDLGTFDEFESGLPPEIDDAAPTPPPAPARTIESREKRKPSPAPVPSTAPQQDINPLDLASDVPVQLIAVLAKKNMTMKELLNVRLGEVIDLNRPPSEHVDLVAGGRLIGRGELVEIDGKLGVRILKLIS